MALSIFTPCNNTTYLVEAYNSFKDQNFDEWLIFLNNGPTLKDIHFSISSDPRVKVIETPEGLIINGVGAAKKYACACCSGEILIEMDQDDFLLDTAIDKIREAFSDPEVVFAYSDCAEFNEDATRSIRMYGAATPETNHDPVNGWDYYDVKHGGYLYKAAVCPEPIPFHMSLILFAPNHVRCFRRSAYEKVGGYDENLVICDDQDLMSRLYMAGKFYHIPECLYFYRVHGSNSWLKHNAAIQTTMLDIQERYLEPMALHWAKKQGLRCLDLGGRFYSPEPYESVDLKDADVICDLEGSWPVDDDSVGILRAYDIIEHLHDTIHFMKEASRVLVPGGYLFISVPSTDDGNGGVGRGAFQDPLHVKFFNINSFFYYTRAAQAQYIDTPARFKSIILKNYYPSQWEIDNRIPYVKAFMINLKGNFRPMGTVDI